MKRIYRHPEVMRVREGAASRSSSISTRPSWTIRCRCRSHYWIDQIGGMAEPAKARHVGDYLAGMTDTYAIATHRRLFDHTPDLR